MAGSAAQSPIPNPQSITRLPDYSITRLSNYPMPKPLLEALSDRVLVCDGAMGTMLYAKGVFINKSFDALNVTQPDLVAEVHQEYVRAGADIIETNTFGVNRIKLGSFGIADKLQAMHEQGARIARQAARDS